MIWILEKLETRLNFLEIKFEKYPFQPKKDKEINLSPIFDDIIDCLQIKKLTNENEYKKYIQNYNDFMITFNYNEKTFNIFRNPVEFQNFYETKPDFKAYEPKQLKDALIELQKYYYFNIDNKWYDLENIINLKKENKIQNKIIIYPFITKIFDDLCKHINFDDIKNNSLINIDIELLEPFSLLVEKKEILQIEEYEYITNFNNDILN